VYYHCTDHHGAGDNTYIREEQLGELLGVITPIQITPDIADEIANAIRCSDMDGERARTDALRQLDQRRRALTSKQDRAYEDFIEVRISQEFWTRKSEVWERELQVIDAERARLNAPHDPLAVTAEKILELAKQAENLYKSQNPVEPRGRLETVLSNCTFDAGTLCPTYAKPFDLLVDGNQTCASGPGGDTVFRTHG
jgi:site-specific DNA recombinase